MYKLKENGVSGKEPSVLSDFLKDRKQRVTLNQQIFPWAGARQESLRNQFLVPFFFGLYQRSNWWYINPSVIQDVDIFTKELMKWNNSIMICIKSKNGLSIEKCALAQTNPVGKLRKFLMFCCVFITALSRKSHIKNTLAYSLMFD